MVKKLNRDAFLIKILLNKGASPSLVSKILNLSRQKVFYWATHDIRTKSHFRRRKLPPEYLAKILDLARNKTTSSMGSRKISAIINAELEEKNVMGPNNKPLSVHRASVCRYLNTFYGKPKKIRKVFYLSHEQMQKREDFCKMIIERKINFDQIMFTDECIIDLSTYTNDSIRLDPKAQEQLKNGDREVYELINRENRKFEKSLMIAGGISYYGLSRLIFLEGTMNDFAYGQALMFYKEDIDDIRDRYGVKLIFEQDGAATHKTKANITLLNRLFTKGGWLQNAPNSPDLAYPIEDLWAIIKPRVKRRNPTSIPELKKFLLEEWSAVPIELVQNLCKGFLNRINKVLELKGARLEPEHLKKPHPENNYYWKIPETLPDMRIVYNNKKIYKYKKREMRIIKAELKKVKSINVERMKGKTLEELNKNYLEYSSLIKPILDNEGLHKALKKKNEFIRNIRDMLETVQEMNLVEYIEHLKEIAVENKKKADALKEKEEDIEILGEKEPHDQKAVNLQMDNINVEHRINELINMKNVDKHIKYHLRF